jgi:murein hydrolase activator
MKTVESDLKLKRKMLRETQARISAVEREVADNRREIELITDWVKRKMRVLYMQRKISSSGLLLMNAQDISRLQKNLKNLEFMTGYENRLLTGYKETLARLSEQEMQLVALKGELIRQHQKVASEEGRLSQKKSRKEKLLTSVKKEKSSHLAAMRELEQASKKILELLKATEKRKDARTEGTGFASMKGKLPWPVQGKIALPYGSQRDPKFNTPIFRSGTYLQKTGGDSQARAVHEGKVVFAEWFKGYGQLVILNHGDGYHTLYGSLSDIFTKVGDIIKKRQPIGRVGNSGIIDSDGLYFEVRYKGKPLDPLQWLQRR